MKQSMRRVFYQEVATESISLTRCSARGLTNLALIWWSTFFNFNLLVPLVPRSILNTELYKLTENCEDWRSGVLRNPMNSNVYCPLWPILINLLPARVQIATTDRKLNCEDWPRIVKTDDRGVLRNPILLRWLSNRSATHIHTFKRLLFFCDWYLH